MNLTVLAPAMERKVNKLGSLSMVWQPVWEKENFEFKPAKLRMKIDIVTHLAEAERLGIHIWWSFEFNFSPFFFTSHHTNNKRLSIPNYLSKAGGSGEE